MEGDPDAFNSSDLEFEEARPKFARPVGERSIELIIRDAQSDRITTKQTVKSLQYGSGAPGTKAMQALGVARFEKFREKTLGQDLNSVFTGDDVIRFFDGTIGRFSFDYVCFHCESDSDLSPSIQHADQRRRRKNQD